MDFSLGEDRQMLVDSLRRYLADNFDWKTREQVLESPQGWSPQLWKGLAELGVVGALFDADSGGYGGTPFDVGAVFGELGRALAIGPFLPVLMAGRILARSGETGIVEKIIGGESIAVFAPDGPAVKADGDRLTGTRSVVPFVEAADYLLVPAENAVFLVEKGAAGLEVRGYPLVDGGVGGEVTLNGTPARRLAGDGADLAEEAVAIGLVALAWEAVAIMDQLRDQTLEYLRTRKQFGIPIGKFQALQHRMATVALEIEQARSAAINAAARFDEGRTERERAVSAAKYSIGHIGSLAAEEAIQMHGGIGMTWELPLSHYAKRLIMIGHELGDEDTHLERYIALGKAA